MGENKKPRDYQREMETRRQRKAAKNAGEDTGKEQPAAEAAPLNEGTQAGQIPADCGHIPVLLSQIVSDPNQPRKFFDAGKLLELSKSIVQHGVIQPIMIRPIAGGLYMVVVGECRFRGSMMGAEAGHDITTIPAMIRELTDDEALELQLVENLHRSNPHPIEDAFTFKKMLEKHTVEEIALTVSKSTKFVAMRIMMTELIQPFQEVFFANKMSLGQAMLLCKVSPEAQAAIFEDEVSGEWKEDEKFMLDDISQLINRQKRNLDTAPFKTEDPELYKEGGACGTCKYNSGTHLQLFTESQTSRICSNTVCFNIKVFRAYKQSIEKVMVDPAVIFVAAGHYREDEKQKVKEVEKMGVPVLEAGTWKPVALEKPDLEKHVRLNEGRFDENEKTRDQFDLDIKAEYEELVNIYEKEAAELEAARAEGKVRKAFVVVGLDEGKIVDVMAVTPQAEVILKSTGEAVDTGVANEIAEINKREERAKELDGEKVWTAVREAFVPSNHLAHGGPLGIVERGAMAAAIYEAIGWKERSLFDEEVMKLQTDHTGMNTATGLANLTEEQFNLLCRIFMKAKLFPTIGSHLTSYINYMGHAVAKVYMPVQVADIEANQSVKAKQRAEKVKERIKDLIDPPDPKEKKGE